MLKVKLPNGVTIEHVGGHRIFVSLPNSSGGTDIFGQDDAVDRAILPLMRRVLDLEDEVHRMMNDTLGPYGT